MAIIEKSRIISKEAERPFDVLLAEYDKLEKKNRELILSMTDLQKSYVNVKKTNDGSEAKKLINLNKELETANRKLIQSEQEQNKQLQLIKAVTAQANKEAKEAAQFALNQKGAYDRLTKSTLEAQKQFKNLATQYGANSKQAKAARKEFEKLDNKLSSVNKAARDGRKDVGRYELALKGIGKQLLGSLGLVAGVSSLVNVFKNAAKIFITFDKSASKLAAILGKTKDEIKTLTEQAKELGSTTAYTASEVLSLQTELAKLGFTQSQIEASTKGILNLAAATGQDLASSAELAGSVLRIFNLDASEMGRVTDVLAKSTTISSLSMEKLATIMPIVGKTAQLAGVKLERTAGLAGTLTDRGLDASTAATSLRNIFLELSKKGLTWEQAMQKINSSTDKNKTSMDLFGKRAAAAGAILAETASDTDRLTSSLETAQGAAQDMANTMLDNLAGDITIAKSAWEGFILSLEDGNGKISKVLRGITQWFTGILERLKDINKGVVRLSEYEREKYGLTQATNAAVERQDKILQNITDKEAQLLAAKKRYYAYGQKINAAEMEAMAATEAGDNKALIAAQEKIRSYTALRDNVMKYIPELKTVGKIEDENTIKTENQNKAHSKKKKLIDEQNKAIRTQLALIKQQDKSVVRAEKGEFSEMEDLDAALEKELRATEKNEKKKNEVKLANIDYLADLEKKRQEEIEEAKKQIGETAIDELTNYSINAASAIADSKLNKETSRIEAEKELLKNQLDKGLINETQYQTKLNELNKKQNLAEAKAARRKALYEIAINTAVAAVKALPNLFKAGAVAAIGALKAVSVAATPLPKFAKGEINIRGKSHSQGGIMAEIEGGESVISKAATSQSPQLLDAINSGKINDEKFQQINNGKYLKQLVGLFSNMAYVYDPDKTQVIVRMDGSGNITKL
jgi:hypothetical protein